MADRRRCFRCGYSLKGLPEVHRCPECGLPYYPYTVLIEESSSQVYLGGLVAFLVFNAILGVSVFQWPTRWDFIALSVFAFGAASLLYGAWRWRRGRRNRAGVCDEGVFFYHWELADGYLLPWDRVAAAVISRGGSVELRDAHGNVQQELPLAFFGSRGRAKKFTLAVHDRLRRRGPLPPWVTTDRPGLAPECSPRNREYPADGQ